MTIASATVPLWKRQIVVVPVAIVAVLAAMVANTSFVSNANHEVPADTAVEFAALNFTDSVVPTLTDNAVPVADLATMMVADPDGTGEQYGSREDENKPYSFAVSATAVVSGSSFGEVGLDVEGMPEGITVGLAVPPLGSSTALRDAGTTITFGDFVNQTEYQNVAIELNKLAAESAYATVDPTALEGKTVTVVGALAWMSKTGGAVDHVTIIPVSVEVN